MGSSSDGRYGFDLLLCLTTEAAAGRRSLARSELERAGLADVEFILGVTPDDEVCKRAYVDGRVMRFPPCFRCGQTDCGEPDCNNILIPVQVAVVLSFQQMFRRFLADRSAQRAWFCEDDLVMAQYAPEVLRSAEFAALAEDYLGSDRPGLLRLGAPSVPEGFDQVSPPVPIGSSEAVVMSNYLFACNRAFAELAMERLERIDHTADMLIHSDLVDHASCATLRPQLATDRSWALGTLPSSIHPKPHHLDHLRRTVGEDSAEFRQESARLARHRKHAEVVDYAVLCLPGSDTGELRARLQGLGLALNVDQTAGDGFISWRWPQRALLGSLPPGLSDPFFLHCRHPVAVLEDDPVRALAERLREGHPDALLAFSAVQESPAAARVDSDLEKAALVYVEWRRSWRSSKVDLVVSSASLLEARSIDELFQPGVAREPRYTNAEVLRQLSPWLRERLADAEGPVRAVEQ